MNLEERKMILRVFQALDAVPGAYIGGGTGSVTVSGAINFGRDIQIVRGFCLRALAALLDGAMDKEERNGHVNSAMTAAEEFISTRSAAGWCAVSKQTKGDA